MRILLVEGHTGVVENFSTLLERWGHEVGMPRLPILTLATALKFEPDIVFVDLGMREGWSVAHVLRQHPRLEGVFLVALSTQSSNEARAMRDGFDAHLLKPVEAQQLRMFLEMLSAVVAARGNGASSREVNQLAIGAKLV